MPKWVALERFHRYLSVDVPLAIGTIHDVEKWRFENWSRGCGILCRLRYFDVLPELVPHHSTEPAEHKERILNARRLGMLRQAGYFVYYRHVSATAMNVWQRLEAHASGTRQRIPTALRLCPA